MHLKKNSTDYMKKAKFKSDFHIETKNRKQVTKLQFVPVQIDLKQKFRAPHLIKTSILRWLSYLKRARVGHKLAGFEWTTPVYQWATKYWHVTMTDYFLISFVDNAVLHSWVVQDEGWKLFRNVIEKYSWILSEVRMKTYGLSCLFQWDSLFVLWVSSIRCHSLRCWKILLICSVWSHK